MGWDLSAILELGVLSCLTQRWLLPQGHGFVLHMDNTVRGLNAAITVSV